ncbi:phosphotransferase [uncultured Desulfobacter sp.]|uniref:phosphotransferase n=1 Tax=uncultured Desulfobacter sp. TaxID=240139 RepID=UPI0029C65333|nr:phosphotransferase [uncultured Desulfobacter sp.]
MARDFGYEFLESKIKRVQQMTSSHSSQIVHGDLHQNNIIQVEDNVLFLDFDSCTHFLPQSDLAFCAFRMYDLRKEETKAYLQAYHAEAGHRLEINHRDLTDLIIYTILQRIFFIKKEYKMGNKMWIIDLKNQESYLSNLVLMKSET